MRIEIICTGDEVLSGKIINSNYAHMCRRLEEVGLGVVWGTTVGDDRERLAEAFQLAAGRADAVIVNGGLGPTVDDLSQEVAAKAAGVELELNQEWLARMEAFFAGRGRPMPSNNRKQAMLPAGAEMIDNAVGTACGFAVDIGAARFFFTPGVPRELFHMLEHEIMPRLLERSGDKVVIRLKRFHSFGIGESRADAMLSDIVDSASDGAVKLGFQAHYPQLETKLAVRGTDQADVDRKLAPVEAEVRKRFGNFVLAEDDDTLEGVILAHLETVGGSLAVAELATRGEISGRLAHEAGGREVFRRGIIAGDFAQTFAALGIVPPAGGVTPTAAGQAAAAVRHESGASHSLAVLVERNAEAREGTICVAIASADALAERQAVIVGDEHRVRLGAVEIGLDCLRRQLLGLPIDEHVDFEKG